MRILFVTRKFPPSVGGMEVFAQELARALADRQSDLAVFKPDPPIIGRPGPLALLGFLARAARAVFIAAPRIDVLLLGDGVLTPLAWIARLRARARVVTVVAVHGNDVYYALRHTPTGSFYRRVLKHFARRVDLLIANSNDTRHVAGALGFRRRVTIHLATGLGDDVLVANPPTKSILFAGRLIRYKGLGWFVREVMPLVDPRVTLWIAGPQWDAEEMGAITRCPRARYLGTLPRNALPKLRGECIACIMPNLPARLGGQDEGFGLSALESAAAGVPVVAANVGGLPDAVVDGVTGFLVPALDAPAFAQRINAIAGWTVDERLRFAGAARRMIAQRFTWERVAGDYCAQFEERLRARGIAGV